MNNLNRKGVRKAKALIRAGKVNASAPWSFDGKDAEAMMGANGGIAEFSSMHLGMHPGADKSTQGAWGYPFGKGGEVYRSALVAIKQRAAQQGDAEIENAAGTLLDMVDKKDMKAAAMSHNDMRDAVQDELDDHFGENSAAVQQMFNDSFVYSHGDSLYQAPYMMNDDGATVDFTNAAPVQQKTTYQEVQARAAIMGLQAAAVDKGSPDYGYKWDVRIIDFGPDKQGRFYYTPEALKAAIPLYDGAKVFALGEGQHQDPKNSNPFGKSVRDIVGWMSGVKADDKGLYGKFNIVASAAWLRDMVTDAWERGKKDLVGFSHDITASTEPMTVDGRKMTATRQIKTVSVDVVYDPIGGGKFLRMAAAGRREKEDQDMLQKLLAALKAKRPDLYKTIEAKVNDGTITEDEVINLTASAGADIGDLDSRIQAAVQKATGGKTDEVKILACGLLLRDELNASKLPELAQKKIQKMFLGKAFDTEALRGAIQEEKEYLDKLQGSGAVNGTGDVKVVGSEGERMQASLDKMFKVKVAGTMQDVAPFESIKAAYVRITGDVNVRGFTDDPVKMRAAFDTGTFAYALGNTLYRRLIQDYLEAPNFGVDRIISTKRNAKDFRSMESIRIAYFGDLPDVNPENNDYPDLGTLTDEEIAYSINTKGGLITITRKMIINDDMQLINKIVGRLPRAARRAYAMRIWNKFINNDVYKGDGKAIFHADHGNLGNTAYGVAAALAAKSAMMIQEEPGSGQRIQLKPVTVVFPTELFGIVSNVNNFNPYVADVSNGNAMFNYFEKDGLIENPFMVDANDWMMFADPRDVEICEVAFLNGQEEPELFVADNPAVGQYFVGDKIQYKLRHEYEVEVDDFRGCYKAVVA